MARYQRIRLVSGLEHLETWSASANPAEQNLVYEALFAMCEGSVFAAYSILDDHSEPGQFDVLVRPDLVVKVVLEDLDAFGIVSIGALSGPGRTR